MVKYYRAVGFEKDQIVEVGGNEYQLFEGEWICEGLWLNHVPRARYWYTVGSVKIIVRLQHVLQADLDMAPLDDNNPLPRMPASTLREVLPLDPIKLCVLDHDYMMETAHQRGDDFGFEELFKNNDDPDIVVGNEEEQDDDSDDDMDGSSSGGSSGESGSDFGSE